MRLRKFWLLSSALAAVTAVGSPAAPQEQRDDAGAAPQPPEPSTENIVVRGRRLHELRFELRVAEDAVYARFNDINSDDRFDIHCEDEKRTASRMTERRCLSNSWREQDANIGEGTTRALQGLPGGANLGSFRAEQLRMQQLLQEELLRLALHDDGLKRAVMELGEKQLQLDEVRGREPGLTRERELSGVDGRLPFGAQRGFEVKIDGEPWSQALTQRTFTIVLFSGEIREIDVACDGGGGDLEFAADVEWTLPADWTACIVSVRAQPDTTFALYEF